VNAIKRALRVTANMAAILIGWFIIAAAMTLIPGITKSVMVAFPPTSLASALPDDVSILRWDDGIAVLYSERPGYVTELYRAGATLVLPARKSGCIDLRNEAAPFEAASIER
jgi:hypothetical protein